MELHLLFTLRTDTVEEQKGKVAFPGSAVETALRKAEEEIGLRSIDVTALGAMEEAATVTRWRIMPIVGTLPYPYRFRVNTEEAEVVFGLPLGLLADTANVQTRYLGQVILA